MADTFFGGHAFHSHGTVHVYGELRAGVINVGGSEHSVVEGDVNGDGVADFQIEFGSHLAFSAADFVL